LPLQNEPGTRKSYLTPRDLEVIAELTGTRETETKVKAGNRIAKMKGKFDARDAIKEGSRWVPMLGRFMSDADHPKGINATRRAQLADSAGGADTTRRAYRLDQHGTSEHNTGRRTTQLSAGHTHKRGRVNCDR